MLVLRSDWQAALPKLTELGNGLALISSLDAMLSVNGDAVSMQVAPMLGITLTSAGRLQCLVSTAVMTGLACLCLCCTCSLGNNPVLSLLLYSLMPSGCHLVQCLQPTLQDCPVVWKPLD